MRLNIKRKIQRKTKTYGFIVGGIILVIAVFVLMKTLITHKTVEEDKSLYKYSVEKNLQYQVQIKDNEIYDEDLLGEDLLYPKKLLEYINIQFTVNYHGSEAVPLNIEYQVVAKVSGYQSELDAKKVNWMKEFPLTKKKIKKVTQSDYSVNETAKASLEEYESFVKQAEAITGLVLSSEVNFCLVGNIYSETPYGDVNTPFELTLSAQLLQPNVVTLEKGSLEAVEDSIKENVKVDLPTNRINVTLCIVIAVLCILSILYIKFFTKDYNNQDSLVMITKKMIRDFGSRMVALQIDVLKSYQYQYDVFSMKDLIKVSDELEKPIFYERDEKDVAKDFKFFVQNGNDLYIFSVLEAMEQKQFGAR